MDRHAPPPEMAAGGDRLSKLEDEVLGHILSFLPARDAARASSLSSRWRHVFAAVHTVSMAEADADHPAIRGYVSPPYRRDLDPLAPPVFSAVVTTALLSRHRRLRHRPIPLRALRVDMMGYVRADSAAVDQWVSYAVQQAAADHGLEIDLRLGRPAICDRAYSLRDGANIPEDDDDDDDNAEDEQHDNAADDDEKKQEARDRSPSPARRAPSHSPSSSDYDDDVASSDDEEVRGYTPVFRPWRPVHTIPSMLFSCTVLRSLTLGSCGFVLPATVALPSVETLVLSHVKGPASDVQRLVSGCPRLADLTLEACGAVTAVTILGGARLRRLAIRCCHRLAAVAVDASELRTFEYRGAVPRGRDFLTLHHGDADARRRRGIACCHVDICGEEATEEEELTGLRRFLQLFADDATHLHLQSARLGAGADKDALASFPTFPNLRHLELWGSLPDDDAADAAAVTTVTTILNSTPGLEALSLVFHPRGNGDGGSCSQNELRDAHQLRYNPHAVLAAAAGAMAVPCLRSTVREINLVHYQGGMAQRSLAKFLLCNAPAIAELFCVSAEGPLFMLEQLKQELRGWLMNKSAKTSFR
uniref:Uncharacterized protein n=1 Tax=Oryza glumipatula TaxID=40148 RepID=A0A0E0BLK8_9ORYZ